MRRIAVSAALLLAACAGSAPYPDLPQKNLQVRTAALGTAVVMGVHRLDANCFAHNEGVVTLDRPVIDIGLPTDRMSLLAFEFYGLSLLPGSRSYRKEARLRPRAGYRYAALVTYKDAIYGVELLEIGPDGKPRELDSGRAEGCQ